MNKVEVIVNGEAYPCRPTMGAMLRFKRETGREVTEIQSESFSDMCTYLWCCVASASKHDGRKFDMSLMDFADSITPDDMTAWANSLHEGEDEAADTTDANEKKS